MTDIAPDFKELLPKQEEYDGPIYWLWTFSPKSAKVTITHNDDRPRAHAMTHDDLEPGDPERLKGYAYKIKGGYRITDDEHKKIVDPFIINQVLKALKDE